MSDAEQTMNEAMYDTDEDLMNAPIGSFDTSTTSDTIVLGNKYDSYNKEEQAIKDAHHKNLEQMMVEGKLYPSLAYPGSPQKHGFGNPRKKGSKHTARVLGYRPDAGDRDSNLTQQDLNKGQAEWNYNTMKLQGSNSVDSNMSADRLKRAMEKADEDESKRVKAKRKKSNKKTKKGGGKKSRKRKRKRKTRKKRRRKRKKRKRTRKKNRR